MRIAYIAEPASIHDCRWMNAFVDRHEVLVLCPRQARPHALLDRRIEIHPILPGTYPLVRFRRRAIAVARLQRLLSERQIDIVHSLYAIPNAFWGHEVGHPHHIITTRGSDVLRDYHQTFREPRTLHQRLVFPLLRRLTERAFHGARFITCTSKAQMDLVATFVRDPAKIHLVRTGVDVAAFLSLYGSDMSSPTPPLVVFSPRSMRPLYTLDTIVAGFSVLRRKHPDSRLLLIDVAPASDYSRLVRARIDAEALGVMCEVLPPQTEAGMARLYARSSVVVMLPRSDGTPVTALEGMLARRPVVLPSLPYDRDLFHEGTVWFVPEPTPEALAQTIRQVWAMSREAREAKLTHAFDAVTALADRRLEMKRLEALYEACVTGPGMVA